MKISVVQRRLNQTMICHQFTTSFSFASCHQGPAALAAGIDIRATVLVVGMLSVDISDELFSRSAMPHADHP
jgi:hypothetical protein